LSYILDNGTIPKNIIFQKKNKNKNKKKKKNYSSKREYNLTSDCSNMKTRGRVIASPSSNRSIYQGKVFENINGWKKNKKKYKY